MNNLNGISWHFTKIDSFQDPCVQHWNWLLSRPLQWLFQLNIRNWLLSSPLCFTSELTPFKTLCSNVYGKMSQIDSFQDPYVLHWNWLLSRPQLFLDTSRLISTPPAVNCIKPNGIDSFQDLIMVYYSVSISMGDYLQRQTSKSLQTVKF